MNGRKRLRSFQYNCQVQPTVSWIPNDHEVASVEKLQVSLQHESFKDKENETDIKTFDFNTLKAEGYTVKNDTGFKFPLDEYITLENLRVILSLEYTIPQERMIAWRIAHPTRGMNLTVQFPKDLTIATEPYYNNENIPPPTSAPGLFQLISEDWIMPGEGIIILLLKDAGKQGES